MVGETSREGKAGLAVYRNVVSDDQFTSSLYPVEEDAGMDATAIFGAVRLKKGFAYEDSENKVVGGPKGEKKRKQRARQETGNVR